MQKIFRYVLIVFFMCTQLAFADEKISAVSYDTAANMLFLSSTFNEKQTGEIKFIKKKKSKEQI